MGRHCRIRPSPTDLPAGLCRVPSPPLFSLLTSSSLACLVPTSLVPPALLSPPLVFSSNSNIPSSMSQGSFHLPALERDIYARMMHQDVFQPSPPCDNSLTAFDLETSIDDLYHVLHDWSEETRTGQAGEEEEVYVDIPSLASKLSVLGYLEEEIDLLLDFLLEEKGEDVRLSRKSLNDALQKYRRHRHELERTKKGKGPEQEEQEQEAALVGDPQIVSFWDITAEMDYLKSRKTFGGGGGGGGGGEAGEASRSTKNFTSVWMIVTSSTWSSLNRYASPNHVAEKTAEVL
eukprot:749586-Hanusia_phi.AAC.9